MRIGIAIVVLVMAAALGICAHYSRKSENEIAPKVRLLLLTLIPPVVGNLIIISSPWRIPALVGYYIYFLGMNLVMFALINFTISYCSLTWKRGSKAVLISLLSADAIQLLFNTIFGQAFSIEEIIAYGAPYYRLIPFFGQTLHRILDYGIFFTVLIIFFVKLRSSSQIYSERYSIILASMIFTGLWETFYIFSRTPIDRSMIGFGVFGLLVYYFSLHYKPVLLLNRMLADVASGLSEALFFFDEDGKCVWADKQAMNLLDLNGSNLEHAAGSLKKLFPDLNLNDTVLKTKCVIGGTDGTRYYDLEKYPFIDYKGKKAGSVLNIQDVTEAHLALEHERYLATHDSLTGLYTKEYLYEMIRKQIDENPDKVFNIAYLDVNDFKMVNDVFGRAFGDHALRRLADNLRQNLPPGSLYGRLGGDCFGFSISDEFFDPERAEQLMSYFVVKDGARSCRLVQHQGVFRAVERDIDVSVMFDRAHMALMTIKDDYKRHLAIYDGDMREKVLWGQEISNQLPDAIAERQLIPYLQAIVNVEGEVVGAEALVRWIHPEKGFLPPAAFIPTFEKNGMVADVDRYIWRCACEILKRWSEMGCEDLFISVNISPKDFFFMDVLEELKALVNEFEISPSRLRIEITETLMMSDNRDWLQILQELKKEGFLIEMDDFGSGYSSLNLLKNMPVDVIKVDMVFLGESEDIEKGKTILRNIMNMVNGLGLLPLTEGVETVDQYNMLVDMGCRMFQGYFFSKPIPLDEFETQYLLS